MLTKKENSIYASGGKKNPQGRHWCLSFYTACQGQWENFNRGLFGVPSLSKWEFGSQAPDPACPVLAPLRGLQPALSSKRPNFTANFAFKNSWVTLSETFSLTFEAKVILFKMLPYSASNPSLVCVQKPSASLTCMKICHILNGQKYLKLHFKTLNKPWIEKNLGGRDRTTGRGRLCSPIIAKLKF